MNLAFDTPALKVRACVASTHCDHPAIGEVRTGTRCVCNYTLRMAKRSKTDPLLAATLFEMEKPGPGPNVIAKTALDRPYDLPSLLLGTSAFTARGWQDTFYPNDMKSSDYLTYYATKFRTVEIDSTYYGTPSRSTVIGWRDKTPPDFIFAAKVLQSITHDKMLIDCDAEFEDFLDTMSLLDGKLGPLVFQFPYFDRWKFATQKDFVAVLTPFLEKHSANHKFAIEIRNRTWLDAAFADLLRKHKVALVLQDLPSMPRPWEFNQKLDFVTAEFVYVRWLGDRKGIEERTKTWDKTIVDRRGDLMKWAELLRQLLTRNLRVFAYANNHYAGHGPATVKLFWELYNRE